MSLSERELRDFLERVRGDGALPPVVAVHTSGPWQGPDQLDVGADWVAVAYCGSNLAIRERLAGRGTDAPTLAVLTDRPDRDLEQDVLVRFHRRRVHRIEAWEVVGRHFQARWIDPRLRRQPWVAGMLRTSAPAGGYPAVPSGYLDAERAWGMLLRDRFRFDDPRPDPEAVLRWMLTETNVKAFQEEPESVQEAVAGWIEGFAGRAGWYMMRCVTAGYATDAVALGLVLDVLHADEAQTIPCVMEARVRTEVFFGGQAIPAAAARAWAEAAKSVFQEALPEQQSAFRERLLKRAEAILESITARPAAVASTVLRSGFQLRLEAFSAAVTRALKTRTTEALIAVEEGERRALAHEQLREENHPTRRAVQMATRLIRFLVDAPAVATPAATLGDSAHRYETEGGFVDWARSEIWADENELGRQPAIRELLETMADRHEEQNRRFGELLAGACQSKFATGEVLPVEDVIDDMVAPLAGGPRVLLLVMDGMSHAVYRSLAADLGRLGWLAWEQTSGPRRPVLAAIPTVTSVCRTSLLTGTLREGAAYEERIGFEKHPALVGVSQQRHPPRLFAKGDLADEGGISLDPTVRREVLSTRRRVVGVVINAVDDQLLKGDQLWPAWQVQSIRHLGALLEAARQSERIVVMTADHGHVLERGLAVRKVEAEGVRFRRASDAQPGEGEIRLQGDRVVSGVPIVALWSERIRYGTKQAGYHGGASLPEVVVPLCVFACGVRPPDGWREAPLGQPAWWVAGGREVAPAASQPTVPAPPPPKRGELPFETESAGDQQAEVAWIGALLASDRFALQRKRAGRTAPPEAELVALLRALEARGGTLTRAALAQGLNKPVTLLSGFLAGARRVLNVDGYDVLSVDEAADRVSINTALLSTQFEIEAGTG